MTDKEMAEEYVNKNNIEWELECHRTSPIGEVIQAFLAGLKAGSSQWHKVNVQLAKFEKENAQAKEILHLFLDANDNLEMVNAQMKAEQFLNSEVKSRRY